MAVAATAVGIIGNVVSILMFMAPVRTFRKIFKSKSTQEFKATPYVCSLLSVMLWTLYGLIKPGILIVTINVAGCALEAAYLVVYFFYADRRRRIREIRSLLAVLTFFALVVLLTLTVTSQKSTRVMIVGVISVIFSIIMYASPLRVMKLVVQTRSVTYMPFTLSILFFINGCVWSIYALLVKDIYVGIPNGVGLVLGALQLILYAIYMKASKNQIMEPEKSKDAAPTTANTAPGKEASNPTTPSNNDQFVSIDMNSPPLKTDPENTTPEEKERIPESLQPPK